MNGQNSPWYKGPTNTTPFALSKFACVRPIFTFEIYFLAYIQSKDAPPFNVCAAFPWHTRSLDSDIFGGQLREEKQDEWQDMLRSWGGSILVGSLGCVYIIRKQGIPCYVKVPRTDPVSITFSTM